MEVTYRDSGDIKIIDIQGRIDEFGRTTLQESFDALLAGGQYKIICNMEAVEYIAPAAIKIFSEYRKKIERKSGKLLLCAVPSAVNKMFEFAGYAGKGEFVKNWKKAVKELKNHNVVQAAPSSAPPTGQEIPDIASGDFGQTIQMGGSNLFDDENFGQTIQIGSSPIADLPVDGGDFGQTIQIGSSPLADFPVDGGDFGQTIKMDSSPLAAMGNFPPPPPPPPSMDPVGQAKKVISESSVSDDDFMVDTDD